MLKRSQVLESIWPSGMSSALNPVPDKCHQFCDMNLKLSATACDSVGFSDGQIMDTIREPLTEQEPRDGQSGLASNWLCIIILFPT